MLKGLRVLITLIVVGFLFPVTLQGHAEQGQQGGKHHQGMHMGLIQKDVLTFFKTDLETFKKELHSGKSLVEIGKEKGLTEAQIHSFFKGNMMKHIDKAISDGKVSKEVAEKCKLGLDERITRMINKKHLHSDMDMTRGILKDMKNDLLDFLKLNDATFSKKVKQGKSLVEIAAEQGISKSKFTAFYKDLMIEKLDQAVKDGKLPKKMVEDIKKDIDKKVDFLINKKLRSYE